MKSQCPFCKPKIKKVSFLSSPNFHVIYNQSPILPGHSLVIPKQHFVSLLDLPLVYTHELMNLSMHAIRLLLKIFNAHGFDWSVQDGAVAGQTVMHLHLHLIPRYKDDFPDPGDWYPALQNHEKSIIDNDNRRHYSQQALEQIADELKHKIRQMSD